MLPGEKLTRTTKVNLSHAILSKPSSNLGESPKGKPGRLEGSHAVIHLQKATRNPLFLEIVTLRFREFWHRIEQEWAEATKLSEVYDEGFWDAYDYDDDEEYCDYTGEECIGNKLFCEECPILTDDWEDSP